jgi:hypothetical protein
VDATTDSHPRRAPTGRDLTTTYATIEAGRLTLRTARTNVARSRALLASLDADLARQRAARGGVSWSDVAPALAALYDQMRHKGDHFV